MKKIYRHGDRTPSGSYPLSIANQSYWINGYGQLTQRGKIEQIKLGKYLRERYSNLINSNYIASQVCFHLFRENKFYFKKFQIFIRSSDYDRTLMSAYSNLIGLYPTSEQKLNELLTKLEQNETYWPEDIPYQPIPVHTVPQSIDYVSFFSISFDENNVFILVNGCYSMSVFFSIS